MCIYYTVYRTTNLINQKEYIGVHKTKNPHDSYLGSGWAMLDAIEKYGKENFKKEILFIFDNPEDMILKEAELVNEDYVDRGDTYNLVSGGSYRKEFYGFSEESLKKLSKSAQIQYENSDDRFKHGQIIKESLKLKGNPRLHVNHIKCLYCDKVADPAIIGKHHNDNCKENPSRTKKQKELIQCPHCNIQSYNKTNMTRFHFDNCKTLTGISKATYGNLGHLKTKQSKMKCKNREVHCPYCLKLGALGPMNRFHFENCKNKSTLNNSMVSDSNIGNCD